MARVAPLDLNRLLGETGAARFFADYWQKCSLTLALDPEIFADILEEIGPLDIARFAEAAREGTRAWVANAYVAHSVIPVDGVSAQKLFGIGATLYFINVPLPRLTDSIADAIGVPRDRMIASFFLTPPHAGAVPHFDKNENFTIQLTGSKQWQVQSAPMVAAPTDGHVLGQTVLPSLQPLMAEATQHPTQTFRLRPGTLLYVPRGTVHGTSAGETSWSLNISYSAATWLELVQTGLQRRLSASPRWRATVTGVGSQSDSTARRANLLPGLAEELRGLLADPGALEQLGQDFLQPVATPTMPAAPAPAVTRFLMKIAMPTVAENRAVGDADFPEKLRALFARLGAKGTYSGMHEGRRLEYVLVDLPDVTAIIAIAEQVFRFLNVKPEFLPEVAPPPYFGRVGY